MGSRRRGTSEVSERYESRREYDGPRGGPREDRYWEEDLEYRSRPPPPRDFERERTVVKEEVRTRERSPPEFLREDRGRTSGPMVLRAREREDFEYAPPRRRSPSRDEGRRVEKEEIIIRRDGEDRREPPAPPPPAPRDREEIIIRREDRDRDRSRGPPRDVERDEFIIRRGEGARHQSYDRERDYDYRPPPPEDYERTDRKEIVIRRERDESVDASRYRAQDDPYGSSRPISHERARSRPARGHGDGEGEEIIIRREERDGGRHGRDREREEIIIRRNESRSPSPAPSIRAPPERVVNAPPIHQEIITHHRHIEHGYELAPRSRPPSPPTPPREDDERIEIHRRGEKNGRSYHEDIIIDRDQSRSTPPVRHDRDRMPPPDRDRDYSRDVQEEAAYYNDRALSRAYPGEAWHGATNDWALVDVPPGTRRVRMDGAGGGSQEISWRSYTGSRRSQFRPEGGDEGYGSELSRIPPPGPLAPAPSSGGEIARRYEGQRDPNDGLWTEITKDLVVKEAITEAGYEYEETKDKFYIIAYLQYDDIAHLVGLTEDIRSSRRKRMKELEWERKLPPPEPTPREPPMKSRPPPPPWDHVEERYIEREWNRPPGPPRGGRH